MTIIIVYDLHIKGYLLVHRPSNSMSQVIARITEEEFDSKLKSLQELIESTNSDRYSKMRYVKIYSGFDIPSRFGYSIDNLAYYHSLFGTCLRIIQDRLSAENSTCRKISDFFK